MKNQPSDFWPGLFCGFLFALFLIWLAASIADSTIWEPKTDECILGGYSTWDDVRALKGGICLGVVDGQWKAEPLTSVRERMGQ